MVVYNKKLLVVITFVISMLFSTVVYGQQYTENENNNVNVEEYNESQEDYREDYNNATHEEYNERPEVYKGKVLELSKATSEEGYGYQEANVKLLNGKYKGQVIKVIHYIDKTMAYNVKLSKGDEIYCMLEYDDEGNILSGSVYEFRRDKFIYVLLAIFILLMIGIGGIKGLKSLVTLILTLVGIYYMLIGIINGGNPILLSIIACIIITILTIIIIAGINIKSISAIIGTMSGVIIAGILALIISNYANLSGLGSTDAQSLVHNTNFDFKGILFASILLGTLGAVMDVCMSISSSINEIRIVNSSLKTFDLFKAGMNIGRDIMGTMSNTLILAYVGASMFLLLLFLVNNVPYFDIINMDLIATEIVRALAGTIGIMVSLPITAFVSSNLEMKFDKK